MTINWTTDDMVNVAKAMGHKVVNTKKGGWVVEVQRLDKPHLLPIDYWFEQTIKSRFIEWISKN